MENDIEKLLKMKKDYEEAKLKKAKLEGQIETLLKNLKDDYNINSLEEAEEYCKNLSKNNREEEILLEKEIKQLQELVYGK